MKLLKNFLNPFYKIPKNLEYSVKRSEFVFDNVDLLYYEFHKICLYCGGSYIDPPD